VFRKAVSALVVAGLVAWAVFVWIPGRGGNEMFGVYVAVCLAVVIAAALSTSTRPIAISLAVFLPAIAVGWWTIPRGDNDGLQVLYYPLLVACIPLALVVCLIARRVERRLRRHKLSA
jgi:hypothetical protein